MRWGNILMIGEKVKFKSITLFVFKIMNLIIDLKQDIILESKSIPID
jgi:hypothetical protein